jgi:hypothetical protein
VPRHRQIEQRRRLFRQLRWCSSMMDPRFWV